MFCVISTVLFFCLGCHSMDNIHNAIIAKYPEKFEYIKFNKSKESAPKYLKKGDNMYDKLFECVTAKTREWHSDFTTYAPQSIFNSEQMNINITGSKVVVNFAIKGDKWIQVISKVDKKIIDEIVDISEK